MVKNVARIEVDILIQCNPDIRDPDIREISSGPK